MIKTTHEDQLDKDIRKRVFDRLDNLIEKREPERISMEKLTQSRIKEAEHKQKIYQKNKYTRKELKINDINISFDPYRK